MKTFKELLAEAIKETVVDTSKGESDLGKTLDKDGKTKSDRINTLPTKAIKGEVSNKDDKIKKGDQFKSGETDDEDGEPKKKFPEKDDKSDQEDDTADDEKDSNDSKESDDKPSKDDKSDDKDTDDSEDEKEPKKEVKKDDKDLKESVKDIIAQIL